MLMPALISIAQFASTPSLGIDLDGRAIAPGKRGTVIVFMGTDCPIAADYQPALRDLRDEYAKAGLTFVFAYSEPGVTKNQVMKHRDEYKIRWRQVLDSSGELYRAYRPKVTPSAVVLDANRQPVYRGRIDDRFPELGVQKPAPTKFELKDAVRAVVAGKSPAVNETTAVGCLIERD
jgi:AhpC/TSA family